jgi:cyclophilin family peptidyl-prolyl cis-trans isomerase
MRACFAFVLVFLVTFSVADLRSPDDYIVEVQTTVDVNGTSVFLLEVHRGWSIYGSDRFFTLLHPSIRYYDNNGFYGVSPDNFVQVGCPFLSLFPPLLTSSFSLVGIQSFTSCYTQMAGSNSWWETYVKTEVGDLCLLTCPLHSAVVRNIRTYLAFAPSLPAPKSRTTQLFINLEDNPQLDELNIVPFARVIKGMEVVEAIYAGYGNTPDTVSLPLRPTKAGSSHHAFRIVSPVRVTPT